MNEETPGTSAVEHSFRGVSFPGRQNELFGDIRTSVGDAQLFKRRNRGAATSELVPSELDAAEAAGERDASLVARPLRKTILGIIRHPTVYHRVPRIDESIFPRNAG